MSHSSSPKQQARILHALITLSLLLTAGLWLGDAVSAQQPPERTPDFGSTDSISAAAVGGLAIQYGTPSDVATTLVGSGVTISNVTYSGSANAIGKFANGSRHASGSTMGSYLARVTSSMFSGQIPQTRSRRITDSKATTTSPYWSEEARMMRLSSSLTSSRMLALYFSSMSLPRTSTTSLLGPDSTTYLRSSLTAQIARLWGVIPFRLTPSTMAIRSVPTLAAHILRSTTTTT